MIPLDQELGNVPGKLTWVLLGKLGALYGVPLYMRASLKGLMLMGFIAKPTMETLIHAHGCGSYRHGFLDQLV